MLFRPAAPVGAALRRRRVPGPATTRALLTGKLTLPRAALRLVSSWPRPRSGCGAFARRRSHAALVGVAALPRCAGCAVRSRLSPCSGSAKRAFGVPHAPFQTQSPRVCGRRRIGADRPARRLRGSPPLGPCRHRPPACGPARLARTRARTADRRGARAWTRVSRYRAAARRRRGGGTTRTLGEHSRDVVSLTLEVADRLGLGTRDRRNAEVVALLHDVGKIASRVRSSTSPARSTTTSAR